MYYQVLTGRLGIYVNSGGTTVAHYHIPNAGLVIDTWYHITYVRNGSNFYIFIDGDSTGLVELTAIGNNDLGNISAPLIIGNDGAGGAYISCYIDEFRISKGIARWTSNFTPPTSEYSYGEESLFHLFNRAIIIG